MCAHTHHIYMLMNITEMVLAEFNLEGRCDAVQVCAQKELDSCPISLYNLTMHSMHLYLTLLHIICHLRGNS